MAGGLDSGEDDLAENHEINVTPFIDVMLVLLIIFMVAAPLSTVDVAVDLPASTARRSPVRTSRCSSRSRRTSRWRSATIRSRRRSRRRHGCRHQMDRQQRLFLRADKTVPYGELMRVMNLLRSAGYLKVALVGLEGGEETGKLAPVPGQSPPTPAAK